MPNRLVNIINTIILTFITNACHRALQNKSSTRNVIYHVTPPPNILLICLFVYHFECIEHYSLTLLFIRLWYDTFSDVKLYKSVFHEVS